MKIDAVNAPRLNDLLASRDTGTTPQKASPATAPQPAAPATEPEAAAADFTELSQAVTKINKTLADMSQSLEFSIDQDSKRTIVKVIDQNTKEVIRQIPSQEALDIAKSLQSTQGVLLKQIA